MPAKGEEWEEDGGRGGGATEEIDDRGTEAAKSSATNVSDGGRKDAIVNKEPR